MTEQHRSSRSAWYRRMGDLVAGKYLHAVRLPSLTGQGSGRLFYTLGPAARSEVAKQLGLDPSELYLPSTIRSPYMGAHFLAIGDTHVDLLLATQAAHGAIQLTEWVSERQLRAKRANREIHPELPIADAEFVLSLAGGSAQGFRLEIDLTGSTSPRRFKQKLADYLRLWAIDDRPVLWVAPSELRARVIAAWCLEAARDQPGTTPTMFWITTRAAINERTILQPIWQEVDGICLSLLPLATDTTAPVEPLSRAIQLSRGLP